MVIRFPWVAGGILGTVFVLCLFPAHVAAKVPAEFPSAMASLNFDDSLESTYRNAIPMLKKADMKASFYIVTGYFNHHRHPFNMTKPQVLRLQSLGYEIGAHSRTHPNFKRIGSNGVWAEVYGSKQDLEAISVKPVDTFVYPYGYYTSRIRKAVVKAGYLGARTSDHGYNNPRSDRYLLKVVLVVRKSDLSTVRSRIDWASEHKLWIILVFHDIQRKPKKFGTTPQMLEKILTYLKQKHVKVVSNSEGIQMINNIRKAS